ncbi:hypothetical protein SERLADRAFT_384381, partial [Serpula lacrymans var. lacrymans S7.9]
MQARDIPKSENIGQKIEIVTGTDGVDELPPKYRCVERLYGAIDRPSMARNEAQRVEEYNRGGS